MFERCLTSPKISYSSIMKTWDSFLRDTLADKSRLFRTYGSLYFHNSHKYQQRLTCLCNYVLCCSSPRVVYSHVRVLSSSFVCLCDRSKQKIICEKWETITFQDERASFCEKAPRLYPFALLINIEL